MKKLIVTMFALMAGVFITVEASAEYDGYRPDNGSWAYGWCCVTYEIDGNVDIRTLTEDGGWFLLWLQCGNRNQVPHAMSCDELVDSGNY